MDIREFEKKYGKSIAKKVVDIIFRGDINEFTSDVLLLENFIKRRKGRVSVLFPDIKNLSKFIDVAEILNVLYLSKGYFSTIENNSDTFDSLKGKLEDGDVVLCAFDDSPEANVTFDMLQEYYPNVRFERMPIGLAIQTHKTDEETFAKIAYSLYNMYVKNQ